MKPQHPKDDCPVCKGTGYVSSGVKTNVLKDKRGVMLKLDDSVPVHVPCPLHDEAKP